MSLYKLVIKRLRFFSSPIKRAELAHKMINIEVSELFKDPVVARNVTCKEACSACCHTQVSVTSDEADLLASRVVQGAEVSISRLSNLSECKNDSDAFYLVDYEKRKCPFLGKDNLCTVYESRPAVCRTNHVVSAASACESKLGFENPVRLLNTHRADMIVMAAFKSNKVNGALPYMLVKALKKLEKSKTGAVVNKA